MTSFEDAITENMNAIHQTLVEEQELQGYYEIDLVVREYLNWVQRVCEQKQRQKVQDQNPELDETDQEQL